LSKFGDNLKDKTIGEPQVAGEQVTARTAPDGPIRMIVVDVDGTLVGASRTISAGVRYAVNAATQRGVQVVMCTGRPEFGTRRYIEELALPGFHIFDAGAYIADPFSEAVLYQHGIERSLAQRLLDYARQANLHLEIYVGSKYYVERENEQSRIHVEVMRHPPIVANLDEVIAQQPVTKMEIITLSETENAGAHELADHFAGEIEMGWATAPGTTAGFINVMAKGVSKGEAVQRLADYLAVPMDQIMGVGDGLNDEPMLRVVGVSVAMGDAPEQLKSLATWVTRTVAEDGLALAIERFVLSNGIK
jgi:Cof subfamily protein (haloacid dehalogenase superfamily)